MLELEVNKEHRKCKLSNLRINKKIKISAISMSIFISLFSGSKNTLACDDSIKEDLIINTENNDAKDINDFLNNNNEYSTIEKLEKLNCLEIDVGERNSLDWLQYCTNLEKISIFIDTNDEEILTELSNLKYLKNLQELIIYNHRDMSLSCDNSLFLQECSNLKSLTIGGFNIEKGVLESLTNITNLYMYVSRLGYHYNNILTDFSKLTFLDELSFMDSGIYDICTIFDSKDYEVLVNNDVDIKASSIKNLVAINKKLDGIISYLNIDENTSSQEKLDKIVIYTLNNLEYDKKISIDRVNDEKQKKYAKRYYTDGYLFGALNMDKAICGNYSALILALANRVDLETYFLVSKYHAWNLVNIDENSYYIDSTRIDSEKIVVRDFSKLSHLLGEEITMTPQEAIKKKLYINIDYYMDNLNEFDTSLYDCLNLPSFVKINNQKRKINHNESMEYTYVLRNGMLLGGVIGSGLFGLINYNDKKNKKRAAIYQKAKSTFLKNT